MCVRFGLRLFRMQASRQSRLTRASVLLARLLALASKSTSLSAGIHVWVEAGQYNLFSSGVFLPYFSMLILLLPLLGLGSKSTSLSPGFCDIGQGSTIRFVGSWISFLGYFFFSGYFFGRMELINVGVVLQEAGNADSRASTISQVQVEYFIFPQTSTFIRLSHSYQEFCVHCIVIINDGGMG